MEQAMTGDEAGLLSSPFCQMAYVTNNLDAAMALFSEGHEISRFLELRDYPVQTGPDRYARLDIALAYAGGIQIELIQPLGGDDRIYRQILRDDGRFELHFHHEAQLARSRYDLDRLREKARARGFPVVMDGSQGADVVYFYADCRGTIGHYVEYIWYSDQAQAQLGAAIPVN